MKLYATVSSERATKGQGGQEHIEIDIRDEEKLIAYIRAIPDGTYTRLFVRVYDNVDFEKTFYIPTTKGKQQKGEQDELAPIGINCPECYAIDPTGNTDCPRHRK